MTDLDKAAQISVLDSSDQVELFLKLQQITSGADLNKVSAAYERIKSGKVRVVKVTTSLALTEEQSKKLQEKLNAKLKGDELAFAYVVDPAIPQGIEIRIGDDLIEFSYL
jgi:F0F1-type ATP synthase delta subunit